MCCEDWLLISFPQAGRLCRPVSLSVGLLRLPSPGGAHSRNSLSYSSGGQRQRQSAGGFGPPLGEGVL